MKSASALLCILLLAAASPARAQDLTEMPGAVEAQTLQCLVKPASPPRYVHVGTDTRREPTGIVRVQLRFTAPDKPPEIVLLANTVSDKMHDHTLSYVEAYRLPCLDAAKGPVLATQEFVFAPSDAPTERPLRLQLDGSDSARACVVMPRRDGYFTSSRLDRGLYAKAFVELEFRGGPDEPPVVKLRHSDGSAAFTDGVLSWVKDARMPCRKTGDKPRSFQQSVYLRPPGGRFARFTVEEGRLADFLYMVQGVERQRMYFDFNTMGCPFDVRWTLMQPTLPNDAQVRGKADANRAEFLAWLAGVELKMEPRMVKQLLGESMTLRVECGVLNLPGAAPAPG